MISSRFYSHLKKLNDPVFYYQLYLQIYQRLCFYTGAQKHSISAK